MELAQMAESIVQVEKRIKAKKNAKQSAIIQQSIKNVPHIISRPATASEWHYKLKMDPCCSIPSFWVPASLLEYLNKFRDNIHVNSSKFDAIQLMNQGRVPENFKQGPRRV
jgi:hypothetical protein